MSLTAIYQQLITNNEIELDSQQLEVIIKLDNLRLGLEQGKLQLFYQKFFRQSTQQGFYLYSGVGRGKTMLMDIFFDHLNIPKKQKYRTHFHSFIKSIHAQMQLLPGVKDPITHIVKNNYKNIKIICLDEFLVHDIADAMILTNLVRALFDNNIVLVTTSNIKPDDLYRGGLQRASFLPAIQLINSHLEIIELIGDIDYRTKILTNTSCYFYPETLATKEKINIIFAKLSNNNLKSECRNTKNVISILGREIDIIAESEYNLWLDFNAICNTNRSQQDYLELAELYKVIVLSGVNKLHDSKADVIRRFIYLIDILYDYKVKLIVNADVSMEELYQGKLFAFEFQRTLSRLKEMQSEKYLQLAHL